MQDQRAVEGFQFLFAFAEFFAAFHEGNFTRALDVARSGKLPMLPLVCVGCGVVLGCCYSLLSFCCSFCVEISPFNKKGQSHDVCMRVIESLHERLAVQFMCFVRQDLVRRV
jgi:hypothetical protein